MRVPVTRISGNIDHALETSRAAYIVARAGMNTKERSRISTDLTEIVIDPVTSTLA